MAPEFGTFSSHASVQSQAQAAKRVCTYAHSMTVARHLFPSKDNLTFQACAMQGQRK
jgi:hypothetical protein